MCLPPTSIKQTRIETQLGKKNWKLFRIEEEKNIFLENKLNAQHRAVDVHSVSEKELSQYIKHLTKSVTEYLTYDYTAPHSSCVHLCKLV